MALPGEGMFAAAASEHPLATHAIGEVVGDVLDQVGPKPDVAAVFVTAPHVGVLEDFVAVVRQVLDPITLVGASAVTVIGGGRELEDIPAVSLWAGRTGPVTPVRLESIRSADGTAVVGMPEEAGVLGSTLVLLADPFSFPTESFLGATAQQYPDLEVVGGLASAARGPGGNRLVLDGALHTEGAVGFVLPPEAGAQIVVSQGCRPVGAPFVVTKAERNVVYELAGQPAMDRLQAIIDGADDDLRSLLGQGIHIGIVVDEMVESFNRGDFLIRGVLGADRSNGAISIGEQVAVGSTVQFQVRDARTATEDFVELLEGRDCEGALLFSCNGRGAGFFGGSDHDAMLVQDLTGQGATAGMFCAGELGPIAGRNALHGFTASTLLFPGRR